MMLKYKALIAPFIAVIAITLQLVFGIELSEELQNEVATVLANLIAVGVVVYGIIHNNIKEKE